jgi:hypothetical protein
LEISDLAKKLAKTKVDIFRKYGVVTLPEAIVETWDPYSISPDRGKTCHLYKDVTFRFAEGQLETEKIGGGYYLQRAVAEELRKMGTPLFHTQNADLYSTELEKKLYRRNIIEVPEDLELEGATIPYGIKPFEAIVIHSIEKAGKGRATETAILNYLTRQPPAGTGWYAYTPNLVRTTRQTLERLKYRGALDYDSKTLEYVLIVKPTSTVLGG